MRLDSSCGHRIRGGSRQTDLDIEQGAGTQFNVDIVFTIFLATNTCQQGNFNWMGDGQTDTAISCFCF